MTIVFPLHFFKQILPSYKCRFRFIIGSPDNSGFHFTNELKERRTFN